MLPGGGTTCALSLSGIVTTLAGLATNTGATDGTGSAARFFGPSGITNDGTHLYVSDQNNNKIRKVTLATASVTTLAGTGTAGSADGAGAAATFNSPGGLATDGISLFIGDQVSNKIRKIN